MNWLLLMSLNAVAEEVHHAAEHGPVEIPWATIFTQGFNLTLLIVILFFVLRKSVKAHFEARSQGYRELVERAEKARLEAEQAHRQIKERLAKLESRAGENVTQARAEANELKTRMLQEAQSLAVKLEQEAQRTTVLELEKAKAELRFELLTQSLATSRKNLQSGLGSSDQKKLQNEFAEKIQVVGQ